LQRGTGVTTAFDRSKHHRRSIRLKGYDYRQPELVIRFAEYHRQWVSEGSISLDDVVEMHWIRDGRVKAKIWFAQHLGLVGWEQDDGRKSFIVGLVERSEQADISRVVAPVQVIGSSLQIRIFGFDAKQGAYPVEALVDETRHYRGEMRLDREKLLGLQLDPQDYGRLLFEQLFNGALLDAYLEAHRLAAERSNGKLRIRLWIDTIEVELNREVIWERLYDGSATESLPLAASADTPFSRYIGSAAPSAQPVSERPVRLLVAVSNPKGLPSGLADISVEQELLNLRNALGELSRQGQIAVTVLPGHTGLGAEVREQLEQAGFEIEDGATSLDNIFRYLPDQHILHFIGHSQIQGEERPGGPTGPYLEQDDGTWITYDNEIFETRLGKLRQQPQLIFLAAGESARGDGQGAFVELASRVVMAGLPAVVTMREPLPMDVSRDLVENFYRRLLADGEVDRALNEVRTLLFSRHSVDWSIPILYLGLRDGRLFVQPAEVTLERRADPKSQ
jgi:hypothetical protein